MTDTTLDDAWAAVEAALPEGWLLRGLFRYDAPEGRAWEATAEEADYLGHEDMHAALGPTPAAALLALTEKLREQR